MSPDCDLTRISCALEEIRITLESPTGLEIAAFVVSALSVLATVFLGVIAVRVSRESVKVAKRSATIAKRSEAIAAAADAREEARSRRADRERIGNQLRRWRDKVPGWQTLGDEIVIQAKADGRSEIVSFVDFVTRASASASKNPNDLRNAQLRWIDDAFRSILHSWIADPEKTATMISDLSTRDLASTDWYREPI